MRRVGPPIRSVLPPRPRTSRLELGLLALKLKAYVRAMGREPFSFWALSAYLFIEYIRPQQIYRSIDVLPWGDLTLGLAILAYLLEGAPGRRLTVLDGLLGLFTAVLVASSLGAVDAGVAMDGWSLFLNWLIVYWLVTTVVTTERRYIIFWGLFLLWSLKMSQHGTRIWIARGGAFASWGATGTPGWFQNSGEFAIQMCIFLPMAYHALMALRPRLAGWKFWGLMILLPGTAAISLLASSSRGGQIALAAVIVFLILQSRRYRLRGLITAGAVLALLWLVMPTEQKERFQTMGEDNTSQSRRTYWEHGIEIANQYPVLGIGYDNWLPYYRRVYNPRGQLPHNIFIEAWAEMGYLGLLAFLGLIGGTFHLNHRTRRFARGLGGWEPFLSRAAFGLDAAVLGYVAAGFFVTVLYYPFFWVNLAFTAALHEVTRMRRTRVRRAAMRERVVRWRGGTEVSPPGAEVPASIGGSESWPTG